MYCVYFRSLNLIFFTQVKVFIGDGILVIVSQPLQQLWTRLLWFLVCHGENLQMKPKKLCELQLFLVHMWRSIISFHCESLHLLLFSIYICLKVLTIFAGEMGKESLYRICLLRTNSFMSCTLLFGAPCDSIVTSANASSRWHSRYQLESKNFLKLRVLLGFEKFWWVHI